MHNSNTNGFKRLLIFGYVVLLDSTIPLYRNLLQKTTRKKFQLVGFYICCEFDHFVNSTARIYYLIKFSCLDDFEDEDEPLSKRISTKIEGNLFYF